MVIKKARKKNKTVVILHHSLTELEHTYYSKEHLLIDNDTNDSVLFVRDALRKKKYIVRVVIIKGKDITVIKTIHADYIFNLVDSKSLEMRIVKILDRIHIPHSGSLYDAIYSSNNKIKSKSIFIKHAIPTPNYSVIHIKDRITKQQLQSKFPIILKPAFEHASVGISTHSVVSSFDRLKKQVTLMRKKYHQAILAEEFIKGKEFHITVMERNGETIALQPAEMVVEGMQGNRWNIYGFREKWGKTTKIYKHLHFISPPRSLSPSIIRAMQRDAIRAFYAFGFRDYARFDVRFNEETKKWYFLEGNANPGFCADLDDAMTASLASAGMSLSDFVVQMVKNSLG